MSTKITKKEVVINSCYGGFSLSHEAMMRYAELKGIKLYGYINIRKKDGGVDFEKYELYEPKKKGSFLCIHYTTRLLKEGTSKELNEYYYSYGNREMERDDPDLVKVVKELGDKANGSCADLKIIKIPADVSWEIEEYDGNESVSESHRTWG